MSHHEKLVAVLNLVFKSVSEDWEAALKDKINLEASKVFFDQIAMLIKDVLDPTDFIDRLFRSLTQLSGNDDLLEARSSDGGTDFSTREILDNAIQSLRKATTLLHKTSQELNTVRLFSESVLDLERNLTELKQMEKMFLRLKGINCRAGQNLNRQECAGAFAMYRLICEYLGKSKFKIQPLNANPMFFGKWAGDHKVTALRLVANASVVVGKTLSVKDVTLRVEREGGKRGLGTRRTRFLEEETKGHDVTVQEQFNTERAEAEGAENVLSDLARQRRMPPICPAT